MSTDPVLLECLSQHSFLGQKFESSPSSEIETRLFCLSISHDMTGSIGRTVWLSEQVLVFRVFGNMVLVLVPFPHLFFVSPL